MLQDSMELFMYDFSVMVYTFEACLEHVGQLLQICVQTNLILNWEKCNFMVKKV